HNYPDNGNRCEYDGVRYARPADQKFRRIRHGIEIGADIDRIGGEKEHDDRLQYPVRIMATQVAGDAVPGGSPDSRADFLDRHHERKCEQHGPADGEPELRTGLAVSADAGRIIIRCAGNESGTEPAEITFEVCA